MQYLSQNLISIRKIAIHNRLSEGIDAYVEKAYRYYSKTYHTPLHQVRKDLTPEEVVLIFFEDEMEDWTPEEILALKDKLDTSDRAVMTSQMDKVATQISDDEWIAEQERILKVNEKKAKEEEIVKKTHATIDELTASFKNLSQKIENKE